MDDKERMQMACDALRNATIGAAEALAAFAKALRSASVYAAPMIVDGKIVEISLVRKHADPHVPPIEPVE